jgi:hypothetical protein
MASQIDAWVNAGGKALAGSLAILRKISADIFVFQANGGNNFTALEDERRAPA